MTDKKRFLTIFMILALTLKLPGAGQVGRVN